jgi:hypothetical protein
MHALMVGGMGGHGSQAEGHSATEATLEKEVTVGELKAAAIFPAIEIGKEAVFTLKLSNSKTGEPIRRAKVYSHVEFEHSTDAHQGMNHMAMMEEMHDMHGAKDTSMSMHGKMDHSTMEDTLRAMKKEEKQGIEFQQEVDESPTPGTYSFSLKPHQSGIHTITFHVTEIDGQLLSPALLIEAKRNAAEEMKMDGMMGMMGMGSSTTYALIGAALMGAMMVTVWLVRGSTF